MRVNLFIAGWPKTGSTSLNDYISQHPDAIVSKNKDSYFFCDDLRASSINFHGSNKYHFIDSLVDYEEMFKHHNGEKLICESSVFYSVSKTAASSIYEYNPNAKIVLLLREPFELLQSWFNYLKVHSRESAGTLNEALQLEKSRKISIELIPKEVTIPEHVYYRSLICYNDGIHRFIDLFGKENVKIVFTENLKTNTLSEVQNIYDFAGIDKSFIPNVELKNVTFSSKNNKLKKIIDTYLYPIKRLANKLLPTGFHSFLKGMYKRVFFSSQKAAKSKSSEIDLKLDAEIIKMLKLTGNLIGEDLLKKWNYK